MPTKLNLQVNTTGEWVDASSIIADDYLWHRTERGCEWYANKLQDVVKQEHAKIFCTTEKTVSNTNFLYAPPPEAKESPLGMLFIGVFIAIMGMLIWKKW